MNVQSRVKPIVCGLTQAGRVSGNASAYKSIRGRALGAGIAGLAVGMASILTGCAASTPTLANVTAAQAETINQTCEQTLGAQRGDIYFEACRSSLADTVQQQDADRQ